MMRKRVLLPHEDIGGSQGFAAGSLCKRITGQGKAELPANIWDMRPGEFPLPRDHSGIHKGDFPGHEVFRTKIDSFEQTDPGKFNSWSQYEIALGKETYGRP